MFIQLLRINIEKNRKKKKKTKRKVSKEQPDEKKMKGNSVFCLIHLLI